MLCSNEIALSIPSRFSIDVLALVSIVLSLAAPQPLESQNAVPSIATRHPPDYAAAVTHATRSLSGRPGPEYWQQRVGYDIDATLDVETGRIRGSQRVTYENRSADTLPALLFRLDQNLFASGVPRNRTVRTTGGMTITRVALGRRELGPLSAQASGGYRIDGTLMILVLPDPLTPGQTADLEIGWEHTIPTAPTFRGGGVPNSVFAVTQWYPRLSVYDDVYGWDRSPYLGEGEFYMEYGDFDVALTVPAGWLVAATGMLTNADSILTPDALDRFQQAQHSDTAIAIVPAGLTGATLGEFGESVTWRFTARNVRDFGWSTSPAYAWEAGRSSSGVLLQSFYRPRARWWPDAWRFARYGIERLSTRLGPYAYPQFTIAEAPVTDPTEYPMIGITGRSRTARSLAGSVLHSVVHQWFPMMVGSMEAKYAWMDEGLATYWEQELSAMIRGDAAPRWGATRQYLAVAGTERDVPIMRHSDLMAPYADVTVATAFKPAVALGALRELLGAPSFEEAIRDYVTAWAFRHPQPWDFFATMERVSRQSLPGFWQSFFYDTAVFDHGIAAVDFDGRVTTVTVTREGDVLLPALLEVTNRSGDVKLLTIPLEQWKRGQTATIEIPGPVTRIELDPQFRFPDVDRTNNVWTSSQLND